MIGVSVVSGDRERVVEVLDAVERLVASHPEVQLLSVRPRPTNPTGGGREKGRGSPGKCDVDQSVASCRTARPDGLS
jgi:hypothetical protein